VIAISLHPDQALTPTHERLDKIEDANELNYFCLSLGSSMPGAEPRDSA
jgi:hypothetical protein